MNFERIKENRFKDIRNKLLLYHLTKLDNLDDIIKNGLLSRKSLLESNTSFADIADPEIITKRDVHELDDYIPFHFHPYSDFDHAVLDTHPIDTFIYITIKRTFAEENNFKIIPKHPLAKGENPDSLYDYCDGINMIDWDTMENPSAKGDYVKAVRMAECLATRPVQAKDFLSINVPDEAGQKKVIEILHINGISEKRLYVNIQEAWSKRTPILYYPANVDNIESIIKNGILSRKALSERGLSFKDTADPNIIEKRKNSGLDKYSSFYFYPYPVCSLDINTHPQDKFVYITIARAFAKKNLFKIIPNCPLTDRENSYKLYDYQNGIKKINWNIIKNAAAKDKFSRTVQTAECLTDKCVPLQEFRAIYVPDEDTAQKIKKVLRANGIDGITRKYPYVNIDKNWFERGQS